MKLYIVLLFFLSIMVGCAHKQEFSLSDEKQVDGVISFGAVWVKEKGDKYDFLLRIKNTSDKQIGIRVSEMHCFFGKQEGELVNSLTKSFTKSFVLDPGQVSTAVNFCRFNKPLSGSTASVKFERVYLAKDDEAVKNKVLAKDLIWIGNIKQRP